MVKTIGDRIQELHLEIAKLIDQVRTLKAKNTTLTKLLKAEIEEKEELQTKINS